MIVGTPRGAHRSGSILARHRLSVLALRDRPRKTCRRLGSILVFFLVALTLSSSLLAADDPRIPVLTSSGASTAIIPKVDPRCAEPPIRMPEAKVSWKVDASQTSKSSRVFDLLEATEFRVDVSMFRIGFENGKFESHHQSELAKRNGEAADRSPTLPTSLVVTNLRPGVYYFTRVLVGTPDGWVASQPVGFLTPVCPVDGIDEGR